MRNFNKKTIFSLTSIAMVTAITACSTSTSPASVSVNGTTDFKNANISNVRFTELTKTIEYQGEKVYVADMGNGQNVGASFALKIKMPDESSFATKNSSPGIPRRTVATDLTGFRVLLLEHTAAPPVGDVLSLVRGGTTPTGYTVPKAGGLVNGGTQTILLKNVKENTASKRYYVAVSPRTGTLGGGDTSIANLSASWFLNGVNSDKYFVTNGGGGTPSGSTFVDLPSNNYAMPAPDQGTLTVTVNLADAIGATIETNATVNDGSQTDPALVSAQ